MEISIGEHAALLLYSLIVGTALGALYDVFRLVRTFLGIGMDYKASPILSGLTPPIIGKRGEREKKALGRAAEYAAVFVFDILYMAAATAVTVIFIYHAHSGTPRGFALGGEAVGFIAYMKTLGRLTAAVSSFIFFAVDTAARYLIFFTVTPILALMRATGRVTLALYRKTVLAAARRAALKKSNAKTEKFINRNLKNTLTAIAKAVKAGAATEQTNV